MAGVELSDLSWVGLWAAGGSFVLKIKCSGEVDRDGVDGTDGGGCLNDLLMLKMHV